ncbi:hypothetical protein BU068_02720 [Staphylococcus succinus]|uniref:class II lanthipeptide, LchA2/BrtA2 family n=1 Tax=Staphylococcus succinus TaxID=61015 RepID=UPI000E6913AB|nr:class II lanthipeptide, LchA2/BrtA2 family [Staphylococcus succinus]RIN36942.1 hypothetical protein BU068_02720 [Staphylococcus succinus]
MSKDQEKQLNEITGLISEDELEESLLEDTFGGTHPTLSYIGGALGGVSAVTAVTAQSPCPTSACSKSC